MYELSSDAGNTEHIGRRDLFRLAGTSHRCVGPEGLDLFVRKARGNERRADRARRDRIHPDPLLDERLGERARERDDRPLRRRVVDERGAAAVRRNRGRVHDRRTPAQVGEGSLRQVEVREDVRAEGPL